MATTESEAPVSVKLVAAHRAGVLLDLVPEISNGRLLCEEAMRGWGDEHDVDAALLRDLLLRRRPENVVPDPPRLRLRGARIRGRLDLDLVDTPVTLELVDCLLEDGVTAAQAHLPMLLLCRCRLGHPDMPSFQGEDLRVDGRLDLVESVFTGASELGAMRLLEARIGGQLRLRGAALRNSADIALFADRLQTGGSAFLDGGFTAEGALRLRGARIGGSLIMCGADLRNHSGSALDADSLRTGGAAILNEGFKADGAGKDGAVALGGADIGTQLNLSGATLRNRTGPALVADRIHTGGDLFCNRGFKAEGAVRLAAARIDGHLGMSGANLRNPRGVALSADRLQASDSAFLNGGFKAVGKGREGAVRLTGAQIADQLDMSGAMLFNPTGPALYADRLQVGGDAFLYKPFSAAGDGGDGAVRLVRARIGQLQLRGADLRNGSGPALQADGSQTDGSAFLDRGFRAKGNGSGGAVRLIGTHIGGQLHLRGADLRNNRGPALQADFLRTGGNAFLDEGFTATGVGDDGAVRLLGARIGNQLSFQGATLRNSTGDALGAYNLQTGGSALFDKGFTAEGIVHLFGAKIGDRLLLSNDAMGSRFGASQLWRVDGLTYVGVPRFDDKENPDSWMELLRVCTPEYAAQPYQQLATACRAEGHDSHVRRVLIAQRQDQIARGEISRLDRWWAQTTGLLLGYGYQPWRALLYLAGVLAISVALALWLGGQGGLARYAPASSITATVAATTPPLPMPSTTPQAPASTVSPCTLVQTIGRGLDLSAPFLPAVPAAIGSCQPTASSAGDALTVARWILQLVAWALAALFIAGFTGIVRKT